MTKITCKICGKEQELDEFDEKMRKVLVDNQMCFKCDHWRMNHEADIDPMERGPHKWAVIDGHHYVISNSDLRGFSGSKFKIKFNDGTIVETSNLWHQGDIREAHPHWREVMPDNAEFIKEDGYSWCE